MSESKMSPRAAAACGRIDAFVRVADRDLGRWILELAERLAAKGRCRRTLEADDPSEEGQARQ